MKHLILAVLIVLCTASFGFAREWEPFIGMAGLLDFQTETTTDVHPFRIDFDPQFVSHGTQFDVGLRRGNHEFYVAYHFSNSSENSYGVGTTETINDTTYKSRFSSSADSRRERRILLGYRYHPSLPAAWIAPVAGGALTLGRTEERFRQHDSESQMNWDPNHPEIPPHNEIVFYDDYYGSTVKTPVNVGGMIEFGVSARVWNGIEALLLAQVHAYEMNFPIEQWLILGPNDMLAIVPSSVVQLRYVFP